MGYVEREQHRETQTYMSKLGTKPTGLPPYLSDGKDKDEGLTYKPDPPTGKI